MKMKIIPIASMLMLGLMVSCGSSETKEENTTSETTTTTENTEAKEVTYTIDGASSEVAWKGVMLGVKEHTGILKFSEGTLTTKGGKAVGGKFTIDWSTMEATDDNYSEEYPAEYLIQHLKSADFFAADSLGAAVFEITGMEGDDIVGNMTIRGITNQEKVTDVTINETESGVEASGKMTFDRQKYEVSYKNTMGDAVISDDIELDIKFSGTASEGAM